MNVYVDSSVVLRVILGEPGRLASWERIDEAVSSELIRVECLRTIDRARIRLGLADTAIARHRADVLEVIASMGLVPVSTIVLERAAEPFPTLLGSLDALHLASALLIRDRYDGLVFATHDGALAVAARSMGFAVEGEPS
ncbi:MAG: type II toxin-antitoxin system VapC family toxin [Candidatus Limnocylindrales bacterium]